MNAVPSIMTAGFNSERVNAIHFDKILYPLFFMKGIGDLIYLSDFSLPQKLLVLALFHGSFAMQVFF